MGGRVFLVPSRSLCSSTQTINPRPPHPTPLVRSLIAACVAEARRRGLPPHKVPGYVRRRLGGGVAVVRLRCDGSPGCSAPCTLCARELARYDLKVCCRLDDGAVWCGRITDPDAPLAKMTSGQRSCLQEWQGRPRAQPGSATLPPTAERQQQRQRQRQQAG